MKILHRPRVAEPLYRLPQARPPFRAPYVAPSDMPLLLFPSLHATTAASPHAFLTAHPPPIR